MKILLIEDNKTLANGLKKKLKEVGFVIDLFYNGEDGLYALEVATYDLLILDLGLPDIDGLEIVKKLRELYSDLPILIISARDKLDQRIYGLDVGADDYLCKPFELDEVIARANALLRRNKGYVANKIIYNDLEFDTKSCSVTKNSEPIELSKRELKILEYLLQNLNIILSKENIVDHITSVDDEFNPTAVETYISRLRKKLDTSLNLKTVRGLGYILSK
jgi:DNA-binding response OmpR family regulator